MAKNYTIESKEGITIVRFKKRPELEDIYNVIDDVAENNPSELRLWDLSNESINLSNNEIEKMATYGKSKFPAPSKIAIVAPHDISFGLMRVFQAKATMEEKSNEIMVFRTMQEALSWLNEK